jgi:ribosomal protein S18 acetylase RimI-like enzyme
MRTLEEITRKLIPYRGYQMIYNDYGYIVWREGTGNNIELLFIETRERRKGYGRLLFDEMKKEIRPYNSIFVFHLASNIGAGTFYNKIGFNEVARFDGLYKETAVLSVYTWENQ